MGFIRKFKTRLDFLTGKLLIVKITKANNNEMICSDGTRLNIQEGWKNNLALFKLDDGDEINYKQPDGYDEMNYIEPNQANGGVLTILRNGRFMGILVHRAVISDAEYGSARQIVGMNVINGAHFGGWLRGDINHYCRHIVASDFGSNTESLMKKERNTYGSDY